MRRSTMIGVVSFIGAMIAILLPASAFAIGSYSPGYAPQMANEKTTVMAPIVKTDAGSEAIVDEKTTAAKSQYALNKSPGGAANKLKTSVIFSLPVPSIADTAPTEPDTRVATIAENFLTSS